MQKNFLNVEVDRTDSISVFYLMAVHGEVESYCQYPILKNKDHDENHSQSKYSIFYHIFNFIFNQYYYRQYNT